MSIAPDELADHVNPLPRAVALTLILALSLFGWLAVGLAAWTFVQLLK